MKQKTLVRSLLALLAGAAALLATSCASPAPKSASADKDYDEVYETGSNLPKRIPKKKKSDDASTASQTQTLSAEALAGTQDHTAFKAPAGGK
jgi:ABC-type oligopeptide transport system substrate-binding subunit